MFQRVLAFVVVALLAVVSQSAAQTSDPLPRRASLGVVAIMKDGQVTVAAVLAGSAAAHAGLQAGDVIRSVDGTTMSSIAQFLRTLARPAGSVVAMNVITDGSPRNIDVALASAPMEHDADVETLYRSVAIDGTLRRILVTRPRGATGRLPAFMIVGGIGCFSIDTAIGQDAYRNLSRDVSRRGFTTLRLEKSGLGDSKGPPCSTVDFTTERHSYEVALQWLLHSPLVDPSHVYLFGHSIGSLIAPRLALQQHVAGVIVAEAVAINWFEYELINSRRQLPLAGVKPADVDTSMQKKELCTHRLEIDKQDYETILKALPDCRPYLEIYPVPAAYMQQVAALNVAEPWTKLDVPVLAVYGRADFVTGEDDHRSIVAMVNAEHPGTATLSTIDDMDHYFTVASSMQASYDNRVKRDQAQYNTALSHVVTTWLCRQTRCAQS